MRIFQSGHRKPWGATAVMLALGALAGGAGFAACSANEVDTAKGDEGTARFALQLASGTTLGTASYAITGPGGFSKTGAIDVSHSSTISATVSPLPVGTGFSVSLSATTLDGGTSCAGAAAFDIAAHATTSVTVHLLCHEAAQKGSVLVNGTLNVCAVVDGLNASPAEALVGYPVSLSVAAHDADNGPSPLAYHWTVSSGTLDDASSATPKLTCLFPGPVTITVAASDGDPATSCADSASATISCSAAAPQTYAWVELGAGGQAIARLVTPDATCPEISIDGVTQPMSVRIAAGNEPLRTTASTPALSKPSLFPVTTCETSLPAGAHTVVAAGRTLPLPKAVPNRIVVIGDTGCRMKVGNPFQACADPTQWPFQEIANNAAAMNPDLVLHVGDYHYRENACPDGIAGCAGSPWGYGWDVWEQDLFIPAAKLMAAAPWIVVRGNHESCARGGQGWYRFLDPQGYAEGRSCNDPANDNAANYAAPYPVPVGSDSQVIVFDSSNVAANALDPTKASDLLQFSTYQSELQTVATLAANPSIFSIFTNHHPLLAYTSVAGMNPAGGSPALLSVMSATYGPSYFPPNIKLVLEGHNHIFEAIDFATPHPIEILSGNGGDNLDINLPDPFPLSVQPAPGATADAVSDMSSFGFLVLDRAPAGWTATEYKHDGTLMATCSITASTDKIACDHLGFLH
jgi:Calcineurin-like phosphoesterase